jgi:hypothetical protein
MTIKRFLVPVLALAAFGLPAGAAVVSYCDGAGCGANTNAAFNTMTSGDTYASAIAITFGSGLGVLSGNEYTDNLTSVIFQATHNLTDPAGALDTQSGQGDHLIITIPATYTVVLLSLTSQNGSGGFWLDSGQNTYTVLGSTPTTVGYINGSPSGAWQVEIFPFSGATSVAVSNFNVANTGGGGGSETPEVGTLLLIGAGLISMRWMNRWPRRFFRTPRTV